MSDNDTRFIQGVPRLHLLVSTGCGLGFFPRCPATAAGFVALLFWYGLYLVLPAEALLWVTAALIAVTAAVGVWTTNVMERYWGPDPRTVVIDEFVGTWIPLLACVADTATATAAYAFVGFALFRVIDIFKPLGCRWIDRNVRGGLGAVLDDVLAGIYALLIVYVLRATIDYCI